MYRITTIIVVMTPSFFGVIEEDLIRYNSIRQQRNDFPYK